MPKAEVIRVVVHYTQPTGVSLRRRTYYRKAAMLERQGERETCVVRLHKYRTLAERFPTTAWVTHMPECLLSRRRAHGDVLHL